MEIDNNTLNQSCEDIVYSNEYADYIINFYGAANTISQRYQADCVQIVDGNTAIIHKRLERGQTISAQTFGISVIPKCFGLLDTSSMESSGILRLRRQPYIGLRGRNVLIGFVDTGIDYTHPVFKNADNTTRILSIWDQSIEGGRHPQSQIYGTEYTKEQIDLALSKEDPYQIVPSKDEIGHGTFLAGIAAGNEQEDGEFTGAAPLSKIVVVKLKQAKQNLKDFYNIYNDAPCYQENDIIQGVRYLLRQAEILKQPIVICIGIGTNSGNHNGNIALSAYLNTILSVIGVTVVCAAGNETNRGHHYVSGYVAKESYEDVELKVGENESGFSMELWAKIPHIFSIGITSPSGEFTNQIPIRTGICQRLNFILDGTTVCVNYNTAESYTGEEMILIHFTKPRPGIWRFRVFNENFGEGDFNIWLPMEKFISEDTTFLSPNPYTTICEPGNTLSPITCATYNHTTNSIYLYSSRGYTSSGTIKPDITAPGVNVYGPLAGGGFTTMTGSSVAAAHTAGVAALILEWGLIRLNNLDMRGLDVKNLLIKGAKRMNIVYPNQEWGYCVGIL